MTGADWRHTSPGGTMFDPNSDIAKQLAQAPAHHQWNPTATERAGRDLERLRRLLAPAQELAEQATPDQGP